MLKDKLEINLITYNRKNYLKKTLEQIFADNSPVKNYGITILDNASTDGTSELIEEYVKKYPNIKHVRHNKNIGGNANICRAYEMAAKEYVWVLCDDDLLDFSNWNEIENAIFSNKYDMIYTINYLSGWAQNLKHTIPVLLFWASFVPGVIYRTSYIDATLLANMYGTISTWFPQATLAINILINNNGIYFVPQKNIVNRVTVDNLDGKIFHRGQNMSSEHPDLLRMYWHVGYMKALKLVKDKKMRESLSQKVHFTEDFHQTDKDYIKFVLDYNAKYKNNNIDNYWDIFRCISKKYKIYMIYYILFGKYINIKSIIQTIFSIKNTPSKSHKMLTFLGLKFKFRKNNNCQKKKV